MKSIAKLSLLLLFFTITTGYLSAQRYVNQEWSSIVGLPVNIHWSSSMIASSGHIITVGNTYTVGQNTNVLLTKHATDGTIIWQVEYNNPDNHEDYGIAVCEDNSGNFYIAGTSFRTSSSSLDLVVLKFNSSGVNQWAYFFNGSANGDDIPAGIVSDGTDIYVTGGTESASTAADYVTIKVKSDGTEVWNNLYDHNSLDDIAVEIGLNLGGEIIVSGGSADQANLYDMATVKYDASGNLVNEHRSNYNVGIDKPTCFDLDTSGNAVIGGYYIPSPGEMQISLVSLDDTLGLNWSVLHNPSAGEDKIVSLVTDDSGNIYVTGHTEESPNYFKCYTAKFSSTGNLIWERDYQSPEGGAFGKSIKLGTSGEIYVAGMSYDEGNDTNMITLMYKADGKLITSKEYVAGGTEILSSLELDYWGNIYLHGTSSVNGNGYVTLKYATYDRSFNAIDSGSYKFVDNEILVQFKPSCTKFNAFNNPAKTFGTLNDFLSSEALEEINAAFEGQIIFGRMNAVKVFPELTNFDTLSFSRQGDTIKIHHFWSSLVLMIPETISEQQVVEQLNNLNQTVAFAEYNLLGELFNLPNDSVYQNGLQYGLESANNPDYDIEMARAWSVYTGTNYARVGIYDSGIEFSHEDFSKSGLQTYSDSKISGGYNYINNTPVPSAIGDINGHGTRTAGLVGAIRNNNIGIASVAGGDAAANNYGAQIIDMKIHSESTGVMLSRAANAMVMGAIDWNENGYNLDVMNISWGIINSNDSFTNNNQSLFFKTNKLVYDNGVVNVCARGNSNNNQPVIPVTIGPDHFVLSVGSSDLNGDKNSSSNFGLNMDIIAPGFGNMIHSTHLNSTYLQHTGTSAAAPLVSGVAALLISQAKDPNRWVAGPGLYPDDVEQLICSYPSNIDSLAGYQYTNQWGWGRLNAGLIMEHMAWPNYFVRPFNGVTTSYSSTQTQSGVQITLSEDLNGVSEGIYIGDVYRLQLIITHNIGNDSLLDGWIRNGNAHSNLLAENLNIADIPNAKLDSFNATNAYISGYTFRLNTDINGTTVNEWVPISTTEDVKYGYSLHLFDPLATSIEIIKNGKREFEFYAWPNPSNSQQSIMLPKSKEIKLSLLDMMGRDLGVIYQGSCNEPKVLNVGLSHLSSGVYFYKVEMENHNSKVYKIIKQ
jgi:subtilisin family serine protease